MIIDYRGFMIEVKSSATGHYAIYRAPGLDWSTTITQENEEAAMTTTKNRIDEFWAYMDALKAVGAGV